MSNQQSVYLILVTGASGVDQTYFLAELSVGDRIIIDSNAYPVEAVSSDIFATIQYPGQNTYTGVFDIERKFIHPEFDLWYLVGGSGNARSKASIELKRLNSTVKNKLVCFVMSFFIYIFFYLQQIFPKDIIFHIYSKEK